jgi:hypothetical protein
MQSYSSHKKFPKIIMSLPMIEIMSNKLENKNKMMNRVMNHHNKIYRLLLQKLKMKQR